MNDSPGSGGNSSGWAREADRVKSTRPIRGADALRILCGGLSSRASLLGDDGKRCELRGGATLARDATLQTDHGGLRGSGSRSCPQRVHGEGMPSLQHAAAQSVNIPYCWHRPGRAFRQYRLCRHCGIAIEECPCVDWGRSPGQHCSACEGSGWVSVVRSRGRMLRDMLGADHEDRPAMSTTA